MALSASFSLAGCAAIDELKEAFLRWVESEKLPSGPGYTGGGVWEVVGKQIPATKPPKVEASKPSRQVKSARELRRPQTDIIDAIVADLKVKGVQFTREPTTVLPPKKPPIPDSTEAVRPEGGQSVPSPPGPPQLPINEQLLEMDEADRNTFFTMVLRASNKRCDQVIRTMLSDAFLGFDEWEALCKDHNSYSLKVAADPDATITSLHCRELSKTSKMLLQSVGSESKASSCRINKEWRKRD
jgi:hypothetical protein